MKVFKFGGASVKNAEAVKNVCNILSNYRKEKLVVVISAMGKTTNAIEAIIEAYFKKNDSHFNLIESLKTFHINIIPELFEGKKNNCINKVETLFSQMTDILKTYDKGTYNFIYDQVICFGELISTTIVSEFLEANCNSKVHWLDARTLIKTNNRYKEAKVNWKKTDAAIKAEILASDKIYITQGFIGSDENNFTTTLGREGSDFTGAIFASCLNAESLTIWKDVDGVLTGDPKKINDAELIENLTFKDAIEMTYYGASIIHPKTIKPLQNKSIPLIVKSFSDAKKVGTKIFAKNETNNPKPIIIHKQNQVLLNIASKDFSFIAEENLSKILSIFGELNIKTNMFQTAAINFTVCIDNDKQKIFPLINRLEENYKLSMETDLKIITIRNYNEESIEKYTKNLDWKMKQMYAGIFQIVY